MCLFLTMLWICVIVAFPGHTYFFIQLETLISNETFFTENKQSALEISP